MIFGPFEPHRRQLEFPKILNERKIIESIEPIDSIERSRDRSDRSTAAVVLGERLHIGFSDTLGAPFILSRVGVTWYTFKQKAPKFRADWYKGAYFCKIVNFFGHYNRLDTSEGTN